MLTKFRYFRLLTLFYHACESETTLSFWSMRIGFGSRRTEGLKYSGKGLWEQVVRAWSKSCASDDKTPAHNLIKRFNAHLTEKFVHRETASIFTLHPCSPIQSLDQSSPLIDVGIFVFASQSNNVLSLSSRPSADSVINPKEGSTERVKLSIVVFATAACLHLFHT